MLYKVVALSVERRQLVGSNRLVITLGMSPLSTNSIIW